MMVRIVDIDITFIPIAQKDKGAMVKHRQNQLHDTANITSAVCNICAGSMLTQSKPKTQSDDKTQCMQTLAQQPMPEFQKENRSSDFRVF